MCLEHPIASSRAVVYYLQGQIRPTARFPLLLRFQTGVRGRHFLEAANITSKLPLMNNVLSLVQTLRQPPPAARVLSAESMAAELLTLHEEMIGQLRLERLSAVGSTVFIRGMIAQHERAAVMLRTQLEQRETPQRDISFHPYANSPQHS
jgi:hypothetical protein